MTKTAFYNNPRFRSAFYQLAVLAVVIWFGVEFAINARANLEAQNVRFGFRFLQDPASFGIVQSLIPYGEQDTYGRVFLVGLLNTLLVSALGIVFATILGFIIGLARLSPNWLLARLAGGYVELVRNLPLLFQIMFWYLAVLLALPGPRQSLALGLQPLLLSAADGFAYLQRFGAPDAIAQWWRSLAEWIGPPAIYLNNRGLIMPRAVFGEGSRIVAAAFVIAILAIIGLRAWARRRQQATGAQFPLLWPSLAILVGLPALATLAVGWPVSFDLPQLRGFNFVGGSQVIPEFTALLVALTTYTAAFIAEVVRAGVLAVPKGQTEAAMALGLRRKTTLRLIVVPQAMRVIIPPLTNQYLNLTKNSTLAVAIGYPDLVAVFAGTTLNQTHQAIEIIAITMAVYLVISLVTSLAMNAYNARLRRADRWRA
ncbi:MAG: ABC transporter permease subunit [Rhizobiales bacterium]|nr:ABC transporter permease subunit [Hyphomicrobiales bacterium]